MPHATIFAMQCLLIRVYSDYLAINLDWPGNFGHRLIDFTETTIGGIADPRIRLQRAAIPSTRRIPDVGMDNPLTHPFAIYSAQIARPKLSIVGEHKMRCDAHAEAGYDPILEICHVMWVRPRSISALFDNACIAQFFKVQLKWIGNELAVKVRSRITRLNVPISSHKRSDKSIDVCVRGVK